MRNRQQFLDEISLEEMGSFGARPARVAERSASVGTAVKIAPSLPDCRSAKDTYASNAFGTYFLKKSPGRPYAIDPDDAQSEIDRTCRLKSNFLAAANHELRQPVQALALLLPSIERQVATNPQAIKTVDMMRQALSGLNHLLGAMREISYLDADLIKPSMQTIDVGALLRRLSAEYAEKASLLGLRFRVFAPPAFASSDSYLLEATLRYLIENALRFTARGGVLVGLRRRDERLRIDVVDTGVGVPTERQSEIFEEFVQLENPGRQSEKGLGLGLAIASRQAALLGSNIEIDSRPGRGSRFSLWMPATPATDCFDHKERIGGEGRIRVLIVEDDPVLRFSLEILAGDWGFDALAAADGEDALEQAVGAEMRFDAILTDYRMGPGMNGVQLVKEIERRAGRQFPALILTGETNEASLADIAKSGIDLAHKPIAPEELREKLSTLLS
jgi:two-component system, sensor histidine kinase and response regulator